MNWRPPTIDELEIGLPCQIIDIRASIDQIFNAQEVKEIFKRDISPEIVFKDHVITEKDMVYYTENPALINRDIRINK